MRVELDVQPLGEGFSGVSTYLRNTIAQLAVRHPDVDLRFVADHPVSGLSPSAMSLIGPRATNLKTKVVWETVRLPIHTMASRPDILHLPYHSATPTSWCRRIITVHDCYMWTVPLPNRADRVYRAMTALAARRADLILTDSIFSSGQITQLLGIDPQRIRVVPLACGPDVIRSRPPAQIDDLRARHRLDRPFILYAGGTAAHKGILGLVRAYDALHADLRATTDLVVLGRFDPAIAHHRPILDAVAASPSPGRIVLPGSVPQADLGTFYQAARVFVFPSHHEGFGLSPLEAMACGVPVIVSNRTSMPEVVGDAAILIDPEQPREIAAALERVLSSEDERVAMRQASLARAGMYGWERTADLTRAAYDEVMSR